MKSCAVIAATRPALVRIVGSAIIRAALRRFAFEKRREGSDGPIAKEESNAARP